MEGGQAVGLRDMVCTRRVSLLGDNKDQFAEFNTGCMRNCLGCWGVCVCLVFLGLGFVLGGFCFGGFWLGYWA